MADCEKLATCPFFNDKLANMPTVAELYKKNYCHGDSGECARYIVAVKLGSDRVPADLFPNMTARARNIVLGR